MGELISYEGASMVPVGNPPGGALATTDGPRPDPTPRSPWYGRTVVAVILASVVAAAAVGFGLLGGGSGGANAAPHDAAAKGALSRSAADSASARSAAFTVSVTENTPGSVSTLLSGGGSVDLSRRVGQMTVSVPALASLTGGAGDSVTVVSNRSSVYVHVPSLTALTGGKSWFELPGGSATEGSAPAGSLSLHALSDPSGLLGSLRSLTGPVTEVGTSRVDGQPTTEYRTTITVAAVAARLEHGHPPAAVSDAAKALSHVGVPTVPVTAWVGRDGLVHQVSVSVELSHATIGGLLGSVDPSAGSAATSQVTVTVGLSHYGEPVSITVPPASGTTDLNRMFSAIHGTISKVGNALSGMAHRI